MLEWVSQGSYRLEMVKQVFRAAIYVVVRTIHVYV